MNTQNTQDILARLLASENLTILRENVATASFDIKERILRLPRWKELSQEIEEMLILHEVGHALYTTPEVYGDFIYDNNRLYLKNYANIIEDVRIEKKMKQRYPGSRKSFNAGYKQLNEKDFFGLKQIDINSALLIDRINIFYKVGYNSGVKFTPEEQMFVEKTDKCVTEEDTLALAQEIYDYCRQKKQEESKLDKPQISERIYDRDASYDDNILEALEDEEIEYREIEDDVNAEDGNGNGDTDVEDADVEDYNESVEKQLVPKTVNVFDKRLSDLQDHESRTYYFEPKFEIECDSVIVDYATVLQELSNEMRNFNFNSAETLKNRIAAFKASSASVVNYLIKEFEMRKSASEYKRAKISRLGQLDSRKLFAYKFKEDIFKQITSVQDGKKHGMIFLLDWSGSMSSYLRETIEQVINLAMFCQKIGIPYQVFAFSDGFGTSVPRPQMSKANELGIGDMTKFKLIEYFSSKMNTRQFNKMIDLLLNNPQFTNTYRLNGTPLNHALLYMIDYIGKFIKDNQVEKMALITLTDGESSSLMRGDYSKKDLYIRNGRCNIYENLKARVITAKSVIHDDVTHKEYSISTDAVKQTATFMNIIRDRYLVHNIGFYIVSPALHEMRRFIRNNFGKSKDEYSKAIDFQTQLRRDKCVVSKQVPGRDELYLISSTVKIEESDMDDVTADMTASQISKKLRKMFTTQQGSRVVLNSFIKMVA